MIVSDKWKDYECLDAGNGEKLERFGSIILRRPDPQAMWNVSNYDKWQDIDAFYHRSDKGGGYWEKKRNIPDSWNISYNGLTFKIGLTNFKHTGIFPEQAANWDFMMKKIANTKRTIKVLNLFAYTGAATVACSKAGAEVVHVDASKGMISWAKENMELSGLSNNKIRFIVDDCLKFVEREARRGNKYDAIIMDPPSYGRGPNNELWKFEDNLYTLIDACMLVLSDDPLFFLINSYTTGISNIVLENILKTTIMKKYNSGTLSTGELGLPIKRDNLILPCGIFGRWECQDD
ncbi:MAG TPA: class I SAM-dependent methyltransferase [Bacilli bacterium]|nr:class I SAM-dependent methyltransferase [Bacilli bacterium]